MDVRPLLGRRQVYVGKDVATLCDQHLKPFFFKINLGFTDKLTVPTSKLHSEMKVE